MTQIIRHEEDGIEFFTVQDTGKSGMSQRGLAKLAGKALSTIQNLIQNLTERLAPKRLSAWIGKDLYLTEGYIKQGGTVKILRSEFCAAVIKHYALEGSQVAEYSLEKFSSIGINTWIQGITGWQPASEELALIDKQIELERTRLEVARAQTKSIEAKRQYEYWSQQLIEIYGERHLQYIRGEAPPQVEVRYETKFVDATTGYTIDSTRNYSTLYKLMQAALGADAAKSRSKQTQVKKALKEIGIDFETGSGLEEVSYLRQHRAIPSDRVEEVIDFIRQNFAQPTLFEYQQKESGSKLNELPAPTALRGGFLHPVP